MKWPLIFLLSLALFVGSYLFKMRTSQDAQVENANLPSQEKVARPKKKATQIKTLKPSSKDLKVMKFKRAKKESDLSKGPAPYELPINDPRHVALSDSQGNLYPNNLGVDEDYVIAYGDLIVGESRYIKDYESGDKTLKVPKPQIWPNGEVPYLIGSKITTDQKEAIKRISETLKRENIINLRPYEAGKDKAYVHFKQGSQHCYAQVGYTGGVTQVSLNERCGEKEIFHEVFHVLGFFHEQNRFDRNDFVKILWENIDEKHWPQFERFPEESFPEVFQDNYVMPFSYNTFMLYGPNVFSNNGDYSIVNIYGEPYVHQTTPTDEDFRRARLLYGKEANR